MTDYSVECSHIWDIEGARIENGAIIEHTETDDELDYILVRQYVTDPDPREAHLDAGTIDELLAAGDLKVIEATE